GAFLLVLSRLSPSTSLGTSSIRSRLRCTTSGGGENSTGTMGIFAPALTISEEKHLHSELRRAQYQPVYIPHYLLKTNGLGSQTARTLRFSLKFVLGAEGKPAQSGKNLREIIYPAPTSERGRGD